MNAKPTYRAVPVHRPRLPVADALLPYLRRIDETRWYSNFGPMVSEFEHRLAELLGTPTGAIATQANGTLSLTLALQALDIPRGSLCLLPSWTFVASAAAVVAAGLVPHFLDVEEASWTFAPESILNRPGGLDGVGGIVVVSPFGAPIDAATWDRFTEASGIPVLIDAAAGSDAIAVSRPAELARTPQIISLHATKPLGVGEGGAIICGNAQLIQRVRKLSNFGFGSDRQSYSLGVNAKMSEYAAAVGLAVLDEWPQSRERWRDRTAAYTDALRQIPFVSLSPAYGQGWISSYCNIRVPLDAHQLGSELNKRGIATRQWWGRGCHLQPSFERFGKDDLPVTEKLAETVLGLPFFIDIEDDEIGYVTETLSALSELFD